MNTELSLEDRVILSLRRIVRAIDLHSRWLAENHGLTGPQLIALQEAARLGEISPSVLARSIHVSHPTLTGILDRLEKRGLVSRLRDDADRRKISVKVTAEGHATLMSAPSPLQERFRSEIAKLEEWEQNMLLTALQRIAAMMDAESLEAAPVLVTGSVGASAPEVQDSKDPSTSPKDQPVAVSDGRTSHAAETQKDVTR